MRPLEILIPILLSVFLFWQQPRPAVIRFVPALAIVLTLIHFWIEGYRWQMLPIYVLTAILGLITLTRLDIKPLASYLTFGLLAVSTALPLLLPVPVIPTPSGPYPIGTRIYELTDTSRKELYSGKDEARRIMIQVWYPSEAGTSSEQARWMD